jgi:hypothetical protein
MLERVIRPEEKVLLEYLISRLPNREFEYSVPGKVVDLDDGGMGSVRFGSAKQRKYGKDLIQVKYIDTDNTPVIITVIADQAGQLFELEFWKVDFGSLKRYPTPDKIFFS